MKTWRRLSAKELLKLDREKRRSVKSPKATLLYAALFSAIAFIAWVLGIPTKGNRRSEDPKSWSEIVHYGPAHYAVTFCFLFLLLYLFQRLGKRSIAEPNLTMMICPKCHTPQYEHDRRCTCAVELERMEHWKYA